MITLKRYLYLPEALIAQSLLESEGFFVYLKNADTLTLYPLYSEALGQIELQVPEEQSEQARELLHSVPSGKPVPEGPGVRAIRWWVFIYFVPFPVLFSLTMKWVPSPVPAALLIALMLVSAICALHLRYRTPGP
jgi:hypothetical protein